MNKNDMIFKKLLPGFLTELPENIQNSFNRELGKIKSPLSYLYESISTIYREVSFKRTSTIALEYQKHIHGIQSENWNPLVTERMLPIYSSYCQIRGTKRALELAVESILETTDFTIRERTFPKKSFFLESSRLSSQHRVTRNDVSYRSLIIDVKAFEKNLPKKCVTSLRHFLEKEVPTGLEVYLTFSNRSSNALTTKANNKNIWSFKLGDQL